MRPFVSITMTFVLAACGASSASAPSEQAPHAPVQNGAGPRILIATGAYIDGPMHLAYFTTEDSHLVAVDIPTGETRWTNNDAAIAIRADEGALLALRLGNPLQAVTLDPATGNPLEECGSVPLPTWAAVAARDSLGSSFRFEVRERGAQTYVEWEAATQYVGGAPPPPEVLAAAQHHATGFVALAFDRTHCVAHEVTSVPEEGRAEAVTTPLVIGDVEITFAVVSSGAMVISALDTATSTSRWHRTLPSPRYDGPMPP